jgi:type IV pilus assembly protein PilM
LQKELQGTPDSFPLFANTPRVSDVLAWLSQHPAAVLVDAKGNRQPKIQIDNFSYTMLKRPQQGKKQEKYQVKVELEFSSPTPKWAREFHDALIAPNDWIDPKGEVKWGSSRGKYKTSFFLKDKTAYPSS